MQSNIFIHICKKLIVFYQRLMLYFDDCYYLHFVGINYNTRIKINPPKLNTKTRTSYECNLTFLNLSD